jgi:hypothetical protein
VASDAACNKEHGILHSRPSVGRCRHQRLWKGHLAVSHERVQKQEALQFELRARYLTPSRLCIKHVHLSTISSWLRQDKSKLDRLGSTKDSRPALALANLDASTSPVLSSCPGTSSEETP